MKFSLKLITILLTLFVLNSTAADISDKAKATFDQYKNSVVNISLVLNMEVDIGGNIQPAQERKLDVKATVFSDQGVFVTAYSNIDPTIAQANRMIRGKKLNIKATYADIKLINKDGTETPLKVSLVDKDENLAFLSFDKEHEDFSKVKLTNAGFNNGAQVSELDQIINISCLAKNFFRAPSVKLGRITSVLSKPKTKYISSVAEPGTPIYSTNGGLVGIAVPQGFQKGKVMIVVIPANDINELAKQVK